MASKQPAESPLVVTDQEAAEILIDQSKLEWRETLKLFFREPMTVADAAKTCRISYSTIKARVDKLEEVNLLRVTDTVTVRGQPTKRYGPAAEAFVVPLRGVPEKTGDRFIRRLSVVDEPQDPNVGKPRSYGPKWDRLGALVSVGDAMGRQSFEAELVLLGAQNRPILPHDEGLPSRSEPALWSSELRVELSEETAKAFQQELSDLAERFRREQTAADEPYRVVLMMSTKTEL